MDRFIPKKESTPKPCMPIKLKMEPSTDFKEYKFFPKNKPFTRNVTFLFRLLSKNQLTLTTPISSSVRW